MNDSEKHTLDGAAESIARSPAPVLFPDTCALLDLLRMPRPSRTDRSSVSALERNLKAADGLRCRSKKNPRSLWTVIPPPVPREYAKHATETIGALKKDYKTIDDQIYVFLSAAGVLDIQDDVPSHPNYVDGLEPIQSSLKSLSDDLLNSGLLLKTDQDSYNRGTRRAFTNVAPSDRGGELKDCVIIEHVLGLSKKLEEQSIEVPKVFLTSNQSDFCVARDSTELDPPLDSDFPNAGLELAITWEHAWSVLGFPAGGEANDRNQ
jgi:hypothetical protein